MFSNNPVSSSLVPTTIVPKAQFRAVILCGYGSDLFPLIETNNELFDDDEEYEGEGERAESVESEEDGPPLTGIGAALARGAPGAGTTPALAQAKIGQVKALLPVGGRKMIDWVLDRVEEAGVYDILVLTPLSIAAPLASHLRARRVSSSVSVTGGNAMVTARIELEEVDDALATKRGNVGVLCWALEKGLIKSDFIVLPCDLLLSPASPGVATTLSLAALLDKHRTNDNLLTTLFSERSAGAVLEPKKDGPAEVLTVWDRKSGTLLDVREMDEFDEDEIPLRTSLLTAFPSPSLTTTLLPTQIYILSSSLIPLLLSPSHARRLKHLDSLLSLLGWIARLSWRNSGKNAIGYLAPDELKEDMGLAKGRSTTQVPLGVGNTGKPFSNFLDYSGGNNSPHSIAQVVGTRSSAGGGRAQSDWEKGNGVAPSRQLSEINLNAIGGQLELKKVAQRRRIVGGGGGKGRGKCEIVIWRKEDGWCGRGNTVAGWSEMSRAAIKLLPPPTSTPNTPAGVFISPDSHLHPSVYINLGEKVGLKRCIVGKGCVIGKGSKLTNCVLMEGCVIGESTRIDGCVLSNGVQVRDRAVLKDCEFGRNVIVDVDSTMKGEQVVVEEE